MQNFTISTLTKDKIDEWLDHLSQTFPNTPRQYFKDHLFLDDDLCSLEKKMQSIFVALNSKKQILSTVRVFLRKMFLNGEIVLCGGIGEVSTKPEYQGNGLASVLLKECINFMNKEQNTNNNNNNLDTIKISSLHTGDTIPLYAKLGWTEIKALLCVESVDNFLENEKKITDVDFQDINFEDENQIKELCQLSNQFSSEFNGTFQRNINYYKNWISSSFQRNSNQFSKLLFDTKSKKIIGSMIIKVSDNDNNFHILDFCSTKEKKIEIFSTLLLFFSEKTSKKTVLYPFPLFKRKNGKLIEKNGMMYQFFKNENLKKEKTEIDEDDIKECLRLMDLDDDEDIKIDKNQNQNKIEKEEEYDNLIDKSKEEIILKQMETFRNKEDTKEKENENILKKYFTSENHLFWGIDGF